MIWIPSFGTSPPILSFYFSLPCHVHWKSGRLSFLLSIQSTGRRWKDGGRPKSWTFCALLPACLSYIPRPTSGGHSACQVVLSLQLPFSLHSDNFPHLCPCSCKDSKSFPLLLARTYRSTPCWLFSHLKGEDTFVNSKISQVTQIRVSSLLFRALVEILTPVSCYE